MFARSTTRLSNWGGSNSPFEALRPGLLRRLLDEAIEGLVDDVRAVKCRVQDRRHRAGAVVLAACFRGESARENYQGE